MAERIVLDERLNLAARNLCRVAALKEAYGSAPRQLAENCPFIFFDGDTNSFVFGDVYFTFKKKIFDLQLGELFQVSDFSEAIDVVDAVIEIKERNMVYICDRDVFDKLSGDPLTKSVKSAGGSSRQKLKRPTGQMNFLVSSDFEHVQHEWAGATAILP